MGKRRSPTPDPSLLGRGRGWGFVLLYDYFRSFSSRSLSAYCLSDGSFWRASLR